MVDLVKLRKKAKESSQRSAVSDQQSAGESGVGGRESDAPVPVAESAPAPARPSEKPRRSTARQPTADNRQPQNVSAPSPAKTEASSPTPDSRNATPAEDTKLAQFRETAGKRREGFIEEEAETSAGDQLELLTFVLAGEQYAVSIDHIVEIVTPRTTTRVPNADRSIVGIMSLRGTIVTIIDVRQKLGHPPGEGSNDARTIVAERAGETLGFDVDRVLRVLKVGIPAIEAQPVVHSSEKSEAIRGVFRHANALTILLDLDKLLV
jgi:purine-binding chemotaxis protein CheW